MKKRILIILFVVYAIVAIIATKTLLDKNEFNVYDTKDYYYICNENIKEYDSSSLVRFEKNVDYEKMVGADIYYFDGFKKLQNSKLGFVDIENETFSANDISYKIDNFLGRPDKAYQIVGSLLNIITSRAFYLIFVIIPFIGLFIYEVCLFVKYLLNNRKDIDNDKKQKKSK